MCTLPEANCGHSFTLVYMRMSNIGFVCIGKVHSIRVISIYYYSNA